MNIVTVINEHTEFPPEDSCAPDFCKEDRIEIWYFEQERSWVAQTFCIHQNQMFEMEYFGDRPQKTAIELTIRFNTEGTPIHIFTRKDELKKII